MNRAMRAAMRWTGGMLLLLVCAGDLAAQQTGTPALTVARRARTGFVQPDAIDFNDHVGWTRIFDGRTLTGWEGAAEVWSVEDGAIVGRSTDANPSGTTNILWRGGEPGNFMLKLEMKLEGTGANGGVQYRSVSSPPTMRAVPADASVEQRRTIQAAQVLTQRRAKWNLRGYQADFDFKNTYTGQLYEQDSPRGIIAWRGQVVATEPGKNPTLLATLGSADELKGFIKPGDWNQVEIVADGNTLTHIVNGHVMAMLVDTDPAYAQAKGLIALEIEGGGTVTISHRNIWLKQLP